MKTHNALVEENLRIDADLLENLRQLGVVNTQYDLSRICGKNDSYYSSMRTKGYGMTLGTLVYLWVDLAKRSNQVREPKVGAIINHAAGIVRRAIDEKCRLRELELRDQRGER